MKPKCFVLLIFLGVCGPSLTVSSIDESKVKSFSVTRLVGRADVFTVKMKDGHFCAPDGGVWEWCTSLSAYHELSWQNRSSCSCACDAMSTCFLPPLQTCINATKLIANKFGGCHSYFEPQSLLQVPVNLQTNGSKTFSVSSEDYKCNLHGQYFDYNGFQARWKNMSDGNIFSFKKVNQEFSIEWKADKDGKLSGRIIRLNFTCSNRAGQLMERCMLIKALGTVTYSSRRSASSLTQSSDPAVPTSMNSRTSYLPTITYSPPLPSSLQLSISQPLPSSSLVFTATTRTLRSASTGILTLSSSMLSQTRSLHTRPAFATSGPDLSRSRTEHQSSLPFHSEEASSQLVTTGLPNPIISTVPSYSIEPSKSSLAAKASSSAGGIDGPGNKKARTSGNDNGVTIGAAVGGAAVFGIFVIVVIVFCKRRKLGKGKDKATKLLAKNPVYGTSDIPLSSATENQVTTSREQDSQPTYEDLITDSGGKINEAALYSSPEDDNYDNCNVYQSLDKKVPQSPVYQSLTKGQLATGKPSPKPKPSATGPPSERPEVTAEPVYNVLEQHDTEHGTMPEKANGVPECGSHGDTQDPLYNVLEGSDADENYEAPNVHDSLYNVLEVPESKQDPQEPLYNVLESSDSEKSSHQGAHGSSGLSNEPLYNLLEGPGSDGPNKNGVGYAAPNGSFSPDAHDNPAYEQSLDFGPNKNGVGYAAPNGSSSPDAHDNPAYEQSLDFDVPYTSVHRPGSQGESVYEPLRGPDDQDLYEPLK